MIATSELAKAAEQALEYLKSTGQVAEAEVFASSNATLIARLNYTSHIPCNGVEEPKSTESSGLGIQAVFRTDEGTRLGFGSEPSDLSLDGVRRALEKAKRGAVADPEFSSLPRPTGERRRLRRYHDPKLMKVRDEELVEAGCTHLTLGQYMRPTPDDLPVLEYVSPERFDDYRRWAHEAGMAWVKAGPFVRSSYHAIDALEPVLV